MLGGSLGTAASIKVETFSGLEDNVSFGMGWYASSNQLSLRHR